MKPRTFEEVEQLINRLEMDAHQYVTFTSEYFPLLGEELEESDFDFLTIQSDAAETMEERAS